jgi:hypothetical protein
MGSGGSMVARLKLKRILLGFESRAKSARLVRRRGQSIPLLPGESTLVNQGNTVKLREVPKACCYHPRG